MPFRQEAEMLFGTARVKKRMEYNTGWNGLFPSHSGDDGVAFKERHPSRCRITQCISTWRYLAIASQNFRQRVRYACIRINHKVKFKVSFLITLRDLDPISQRKHFPSCMLASLGALEFTPGGGRRGESADSSLCSARGP